MADVPRLEGRAHDRVFVDGEPLTDEERELAAITVACHRRGWELAQDRRGSWHVVKLQVSRNTPAEAYKSALEAEK